MGAHSLLSPSSAPRWMRCPGSVALSYGAEDESSEYADEGTAAHSLASTCLEAGVAADAYVGKVIDVLNEDGTVRRQFTVDDDMAAAVQVYIDAVMREPGTRLIEQRVDYSSVIGVPESTGTADAITFDCDASTIGVHDLKFGRGVKVYAFEEDDDGNTLLNEQLALYALGALTEHDLVCDWTHVKLAVHQPRIDHYDEITVPVDQLRAFGQSARAKAAEAMSVFKANGAPIPGVDLTDLLSPGEKQCRFCKGAAVCPALKARNNKLVFDALDAPVDVEDLPGDQLPLPEDLALLEVFLTAARSRIQRELQAGHTVSGWKLVQGKRGARQWIGEKLEEVEAQLKKWRLKADEIYNKKLISPTQADKLFKGDSKKMEKLAEFITQSDGGQHVAPDTDKRPAIEKADVGGLLADDSDLI